MHLKFTHVVVSINSFSIFIAEQYFIVCMCHISIQLLTDVWVIMNEAAINNRVQSICVNLSVHFALEYT